MCPTSCIRNRVVFDTGDVGCKPGSIRPAGLSNLMAKLLAQLPLRRGHFPRTLAGSKSCQTMHAHQQQIVARNGTFRPSLAAPAVESPQPPQFNGYLNRFPGFGTYSFGELKRDSSYHYSGWPSPLKQTMQRGSCAFLSWAEAFAADLPIPSICERFVPIIL